MSQIISSIKRTILWLLAFLSHLFKCFWVFFPAMLFLILAFACFWVLGQGKDLMIAFAENRQARLFFFIAIAYWTYTAWYSSRIIAYMVAKKQGHHVQFKSTAVKGDAEAPAGNIYFQIPEKWLKRFPRLIGFSCLLIVELAVLQLNVYEAPAFSSGIAKLIFIILFFAYLFLNNILDRFFENNQRVTWWIFYALLILFSICIIVLLFLNQRLLMPLVWVMIILHLVFVFYIHLRRMENVDEGDAGKGYPRFIRKINCRLLSRLHIPLNEFGHFTWFNIIGIAGVAVYGATIISKPFSWTIGPFPFVLLAFAVLTGVLNIITAVSVRANVNFHLILFLLAALIPSKETHYIRTFHLNKNLPDTAFQQRQDIKEYYARWMSDTNRIAAIDTGSRYDVYFVMANGGASRSGYWTASVLGTLDDTTHGDFSKHLFCLSGASGGSVGNATFFSLLREKQKLPNSIFLLDTAARSYLKNDFLTYTLARMLGPDYLKFILHTKLFGDRASALDQILEDGSSKSEYPLKPDFSQRFSSLITTKGTTSTLPVICINVTRMQDGNPGVVSNIIIDSSNFNNRVDVLNLLQKGKDICLSTATLLGARFPYLSPAGRIDKIFPKQIAPNKIKDSIVPNYFVDGGYFDNSGAGVVQEMIRVIRNINRDSAGTAFGARAKKLHFIVLHITNSPLGESALKKVSPLQNDLTAPLRTLAGAFDKQTTVNDSRLVNLLADIDSSRGVYYPISLYKDKKENPNNEPEEPYAMNWFISQHILERMNERLHYQPYLDSLIHKLLKKPLGNATD
ncbi:MAG: hypothetical protein ABIN97_20700 [Ginsengibacter sp.]